MQEGVHCGFKTYPEKSWLVADYCCADSYGLWLGSIDSATHSFAVSTGKAWHVQRQSMFMLFGRAIVTASLAFDYRVLKNYATKLYILNIILLLAVMFVGQSQLGAQRWIQIGSMSFQPSEFAKVFLIICLATFMDKRIE